MVANNFPTICSSIAISAPKAELSTAPASCEYIPAHSFGNIKGRIGQFSALLLIGRSGTGSSSEFQGHSISLFFQ